VGAGVITVAGLTPSLDLTYVVEDLRLGEIHRPRELVACAGGKSLNMARVAARLGADVRVIAVLGGPTGHQVAERLAADGVAFDVVTSPTETRTCVSIASGSSDELTEIYQYAPAMPAEVWSRVLSAVDADLALRAGWLSISGAPPAGLPDDALADLVRLGHARGVRVALDTHGAALAAAVDVRPDLVKVNRVEAAELIAVDPAGADLVQLAEELRARAGALVVITDGRAGSVAVDGSDTHRVPSSTRPGRFPVGSGDSFMGGLVVALDRGEALPDALRTAAAAGAANALVPGPGVLDLDDLETILAEVVIERARAAGHEPSTGSAHSP
jgi:1-phosphofructokinase family hexose kinase